MDKVTCYLEYMDALHGRGDTYVFRGQKSSNYILIPSGLRDENIKKADRQMFKFVDEMKRTFGFDELTCIEIAQHFSLPTRMLDFSYSFDVALFFACYDKTGHHKDEDGMVYIFNKTKYEKILKEQNRLSSQVVRSNKFIYEWLQKYIDKKSTIIGHDELDLPLFVDATQQFDRLYMQKGLFLLWGMDDLCFEKICEKEGIDMSSFIETITIKAESKDHILDELKKKNIYEDTLFMNVGLIKNLVEEIKS